jgi:hypothetical protein
MKTTIAITIDTGVIESIKAKGLNVSGLCESALREINDSFIHQTLPDNCRHRWTFPFSVPRGLAKECLKCGMFESVKIQSHSETVSKYKKHY